MKTLTAEKVKTSGDIPTPRFGHTFTMVSPNKAVMFGGAVSLNSTPPYTQTNSSSPTKPTSTTSPPAAGPNSTSNTTSSPQKEQPTQQSQSQKINSSSTEEQPRATKDSSKISSTSSTSANSKPHTMQTSLENHRSRQQD